MVNGVNGNVSSLQVLRATQAFNRANQAKINQVEEQVPDVQDKVELSGNLGFKQSGVTNNLVNQHKSYINDVKQFMNGKIDLSDEEIGYAIKYGRSVLVDQRA